MSPETVEILEESARMALDALVNDVRSIDWAW